MNKLKDLIKQYGRWSELSIYIERIESQLDIDFSLSLENAKALLECICKEICDKKNVYLGSNPSVNVVLKKGFKSIGYSSNDLVLQVSSALATIGQQMGNLRNDIGITSHGKSLEEIKARNDQVDILTKEFLIDTVELVSIFLIRNFESSKNLGVSDPLEDAPDYFEAEEFNESWDETFGEFSMGDYSYTASEILFNVDRQAYGDEYKMFVDLTRIEEQAANSDEIEEQA